MYLRYRYNNIRIKKNDEWKLVFLMTKDAYKLIVVFFGLKNSLITFQTMIYNF